jgi:hypothetical protein
MIRRLQSLVDTYEERAIESLWTAFSTRIGEAEIARGQSSEDWWKGYESSLNVVGAISSDLLSHVQSAADEGIPPVFDLGRVFSSIVPTYLTSSGTALRSHISLDISKSNRAVDQQSSHSCKEEVLFSLLNLLERCPLN